jgi:hypothetical protein
MILIPQGKRSSKCWKPTFYDSIQLIQPNLYATIGLTARNVIANEVKQSHEIAEPVPSFFEIALADFVNLAMTSEESRSSQ